jgi:hypothetical protein
VWIRAIYPEMYYMYLYVFVQSWPWAVSHKERMDQSLIKVANRARQDASASRLCAFRSSVLAVAADTGWVAANCRKSERGVTDTDRCHRWATALSSGVCGGRLLLHTIVQDVKVGVEFGEEVPSRKLFKAASAARLSRPLHRRTRHRHQRRASPS